MLSTSVHDNLGAVLSGHSLNAAFAAAPSTSGDGSTAAIDEGGLDWLASAVSSGGQGPTKGRSAATTGASRSLGTSRVTNEKSVGASRGWLAAGTACGNLSLPVDEQKQSYRGQRAPHGSAAPVSTPGGWLTAAVVSKAFGVPGDGDNNGIGGCTGHIHSDTADTATQTDHVEIAEVKVTQSTKPKLPPWAKPWTAPARLSDPSPPADGTVISPKKNELESEAPLSAAGIDWITQTPGAEISSTAQGMTLADV